MVVGPGSVGEVVAAWELCIPEGTSEGFADGAALGAPFFMLSGERLALGAWLGKLDGGAGGVAGCSLVGSDVTVCRKVGVSVALGAFVGVEVGVSDGDVDTEGCELGDSDGTVSDGIIVGVSVPEAIGAEEGPAVGTMFVTPKGDDNGAAVASIAVGFMVGTSVPKAVGAEEGLSFGLLIVTTWDGSKVGDRVGLSTGCINAFEGPCVGAKIGFSSVLLVGAADVWDGDLLILYDH